MSKPGFNFLSTPAQSKPIGFGTATTGFGFGASTSTAAAPTTTSTFGFPKPADSTSAPSIPSFGLASTGAAPASAPAGGFSFNTAAPATTAPQQPSFGGFGTTTGTGAAGAKPLFAGFTSTQPPATGTATSSLLFPSQQLQQPLQQQQQVNTLGIIGEHLLEVKKSYAPGKKDDQPVAVLDESCRINSDCKFSAFAYRKNGQKAGLQEVLHDRENYFYRSGPLWEQVFAKLPRECDSLSCRLRATIRHQSNILQLSSLELQPSTIASRSIALQLKQLSSMKVNLLKLSKHTNDVQDC